MKPLISVIVPIYGVESYLHQCVDSIINQTYNNLQIILVDDESPDNCGKMCDEYALCDARIQVIHKKNGGLSDARNAGLRVAQGEYIVFVDSDDWMQLDGIDYMYHLAMKHSADLVIGGVEKIDDDTKNVIWTTTTENQTFSECYTKQEAMKDMLINGCASWARLYKRNIHIDIQFPVGEINEDEAIVFDILERCQTIVKTNRVVYKYRYRCQSITSTKWHRKKLDWCYHCEKNLKYVLNVHPLLARYAQNRYRSSLVWALNNMSAYPDEFSDLIPIYRKKLRNALSDKNGYKEMEAKEKFRAILLVYFYKLYSKLIRVAKKSYT